MRNIDTTYIRNLCANCYESKNKDEDKEECTDELKALQRHAPIFHGLNLEQLLGICRKCNYDRPYVKNALTPREDPANPQSL